MRAYSLNHLGDHELLRDLAALVAEDRTTTTAALLAHVAEVDARRLEMPALVQPILDEKLASPEQVGSHAAERVGAFTDEHAPAHVEVAAPRSMVKPHAPERFALHLTIGQATYG